MAITFDVQPGYQFSASERVTYSKLNLLGTPGLTLNGTVDSSEITDGAVTTQKLASSLDINSKIDDHNLSLSKLAQGTHGQVLYYDTIGDLVTLAPGTSGYFLKTNGDASNPEWAAQAGVSSINIDQIATNGANKFISTDNSGAIQWEAKSSLGISVAHVWEQQTQNTHAGASDSTDQTRVLNQSTDLDSIITSLAGNQFTLQAGKYAAQGVVPGNDTGNFTSWLYNVTDAAIAVKGTSVYFGSSDTETHWSTISGSFEITDQKVFEIRFRSKLSKASHGLGRAADVTGQVEVYTQMQITKLS